MLDLCTKVSMRRCNQEKGKECNVPDYTRSLEMFSRTSLMPAGSSKTLRSEIQDVNIIF